MEFTKKDKEYVDVLDEDKKIAGQKYVCLSFISPEKILKKKEVFFFQEYLKQWDMNKSLDKYTHFMSFISYKYDLPVAQLTEDLQEFCKTEKDNLFSTTIEDEYKSFLDVNETKLEKIFTEDNMFQTNVRGIKVRGSYETQEEAELQCKNIRKVDPNHDVYIGPVGQWVPFHPEAYKTGKVEYLEEELNTLMSEKNKNDEKVKNEFDERVKESKEKAIEDNIKKAEESGNILTQNINEKGELYKIVESVPTL